MNKLFMIHQQSNPFNTKDSEFNAVGPLIECQSHNEVFSLTQGDWAGDDSVRSTMVGDIFEELNDLGTTCWRVDSVGLSEVKNPNHILIEDLKKHKEPLSLLNKLFLS